MTTTWRSAYPYLDITLSSLFCLPLQFSWLRQRGSHSATSDCTIVCLCRVRLSDLLSGTVSNRLAEQITTTKGHLKAYQRVINVTSVAVYSVPLSEGTSTCVYTYEERTEFFLVLRKPCRKRVTFEPTWYRNNARVFIYVLLCQPRLSLSCPSKTLCKLLVS